MNTATYEKGQWVRNTKTGSPAWVVACWTHSKGHRIIEVKGVCHRGKPSYWRADNVEAID